MIKPTTMEEYLFDLRGYTIIREALTPDDVGAMNEWIDKLPPLEKGQWHGRVEVASYRGINGMNLQHLYEAGEIFERLIDHPSWIGGPHQSRSAPYHRLPLLTRSVSQPLGIRPVGRVAGPPDTTATSNRGAYRSASSPGSREERVTCFAASKRT